MIKFIAYYAIMELVPLEKMAEMIEKKRKKTGDKQKKIASMTNLSTSQVNRIENNTTNPTYSSVHAIWNALEKLEKQEAEKAENLMHREIEWVEKNDTLQDAIKKMKENDYSQLPVKQEDSIGRITESDIMISGNPDQKIQKVMGKSLIEVRPDTGKDAVEEILKEEPAVLVTEQDEYNGIITKTDLL